MIFGNVPVLSVALALPLALLVAWVFGSIAQWLLRGRARLGVASLIVTSVLGTSLGLLVAGLLRPDGPLWSVLTLSLALGATVLSIAGYSALATHFQPPVGVEPIAEVIRRGESDRVEFKSSARWNLRTQARDEKIEQVVAKTVAGFLNADGGTLVLGVADDGTAIGLANDFALVKAPDADRYELWLRDFLATNLGQNAAALPTIDFSPVAVDGVDTVLCRVACPASPRPVYLKASRAAVSEFWVRTGNSTRQLGIDQAADYVMHRWPLNLGSTVAAQFRAVVRFSGGR